MYFLTNYQDTYSPDSVQAPSVKWLISFRPFPLDETSSFKADSMNQGKVEARHRGCARLRSVLFLFLFHKLDVTRHHHHVIHAVMVMMMDDANRQKGLKWKSEIEAPYNYVTTELIT